MTKRPALKWLLLLANALAVAWWIGHWIAMGFWASWPAAILIGWFTIVPIVLSICFGLALANFAVPPGRSLLLTALSFLLGASLAWGWVRLDDWTFEREAYQYESGYHRPRWFPFQSIELEQDESGDPIVYE